MEILRNNQMEVQYRNEKYCNKNEKKIIKLEDRPIETSQTKMQEKKYETEDSFNMGNI